jgi:hypothetical protein
LNISDGTLHIKEGQVVDNTNTVASLSIDAGAKLDLVTNQLIIDSATRGSWSNGSYDGITGMIASGRIVAPRRSHCSPDWRSRRRGMSA